MYMRRTWGVGMNFEGGWREGDRGEGDGDKNVREYVCGRRCVLVQKSKSIDPLSRGRLRYAMQCYAIPYALPPQPSET